MNKCYLCINHRGGKCDKQRRDACLSNSHSEFSLKGKEKSLLFCDKKQVGVNV